MMAGPVALLGGMEHFPVCADLDRELLERLGVSRPRVAVIPAASWRRKRPETAALARGYWGSLGASVTVAHPDHGLDRSLDVVNAADLIVLTGGVPNLLVNALGASPLWDLIDQRWRQGAGVSGSSAGAMALFQWRIRLYPPNPLKLIPGLGVLHGYVAAPHFDRLRVGSWGPGVAHRLRGNGVIGLDEGTALIGDEDGFSVAGMGRVTVIENGTMSTYPSGSEIDLPVFPKLVERTSEAVLALA